MSADDIDTRYWTALAQSKRKPDVEWRNRQRLLEPFDWRDRKIGVFELAERPEVIDTIAKQALALAVEEALAPPSVPACPPLTTVKKGARKSIPPTDDEYRSGLEDAMLLARTRHRVDTGEAHRLRIKAQLPLSVIAKAVGVAAATVCRWDQGQRHPTGRPALLYGKILDAIAEDFE